MKMFTQAAYCILPITHLARQHVPSSGTDIRNGWALHAPEPEWARAKHGINPYNKDYPDNSTDC